MKEQLVPPLPCVSHVTDTHDTIDFILTQKRFTVIIIIIIIIVHRVLLLIAQPQQQQQQQQQKTILLTDALFASCPHLHF